MCDNIDKICIAIIVCVAPIISAVVTIVCYRIMKPKR